MSWVTDVVLFCSTNENYDDLVNLDGYRELPKAIAEINAWLEEHKHNPLLAFSELDGSEKAMQANVYGGAFNFLKIDPFIEAVMNAKWNTPESVQLMIKDEEENWFTLHENK